MPVNFFWVSYTVLLAGLGGVGAVHDLLTVLLVEGGLVSLVCSRQTRLLAVVFWGGQWALFCLVIVSTMPVTGRLTWLLVEGGMGLLAFCKVSDRLTRLLVDLGVVLGVFLGGLWAGFGVLLANVLSVTKGSTGLLVEGGLVLLASCKASN